MNTIKVYEVQNLQLYKELVVNGWTPDEHNPKNNLKDSECEYLWWQKETMHKDTPVLLRIGTHLSPNNSYVFALYIRDGEPILSTFEFTPRHFNAYDIETLNKIVDFTLVNILNLIDRYVELLDKLEEPHDEQG